GWEGSAFRGSLARVGTSVVETAPLPGSGARTRGCLRVSVLAAPRGAWRTFSRDFHTAALAGMQWGGQRVAAPSSRGGRRTGRRKNGGEEFRPLSTSSGTSAAQALLRPKVKDLFPALSRGRDPSFLTHLLTKCNNKENF